MFEGEGEITEKALIRVSKLIEELSDDYQSLRVEIDELAHLVDICSDRLPKRFVSLVKEADNGTPASDSGMYLLKNRLKASLEVGKQYPTEKNNEHDQNTFELIPRFHLGEKDKARVYELCTDMRKIIFASEVFDEPHKVRLLNRIAAIEKEVHRELGKLDTVLAGVVDIGDALGKFGRKVEPLTKRMKEVADITRGGSKQYEQIPASEEPLGLPAPDEE